MPRPGLTWQNGKLPPNTTVFAIGDIHANHQMLGTLLGEIEKKIKAIRVEKPDQKIHIVGIGDYIDRGDSAPKTVDMLIQFKEKMSHLPNVEITYLCGNHDEVFKRLLEVKSISSQTDGNLNNWQDKQHMLTREDGSMSLQGVVNWMGSGGGITTLRNYCNVPPDLLPPPNTDKSIDLTKVDIKKVNDVITELKQKVPDRHKEFFKQVYDNNHLILGDYLFTHAGVDPDKTLEEQGIIPNKQLEGLEKINSVDIRNEFLWRDKVDKCPYIVVHGHTPSAILDSNERGQNMVVVDPQKPYRLCIDTSVYGENGTLTAALLSDREPPSFMAVSNKDPSYVSEYSIAPNGPKLAEEQHAAKLPQYHPGGQKYFGRG